MTELRRSRLNLPAAPSLLSPGNAAIYKVYVILTTVNERGSNPVTITRPV